MNQKIFIVGAFLALVVSGTWAQEAKIVEYAQQLSKSYAKDGITIQSGIGADGIQNLAVLANGGYFPLEMRAKAGVPSVLRIYTDKTYDCSRAFVLPDLKKQAVLPVKGVTTFEIPAQKKGATLFGTCGMGMYTFEIRFE